MKLNAGMLQWGNVHLSMARKFLDDAAMKGTFKDLESRIKSEFDSAAAKYKEALGIKTDFYDGEMQLGQVDFERAKLAAGFLPEPVRCSVMPHTPLSPPSTPTGLAGSIRSPVGKMLFSNLEFRAGNAAAALILTDLSAEKC